jgi:hypothetical protein
MMEAELRCYVCGELAATDDRCFGCGAYVHDACEANPANPPTGHGHAPDDHLLGENDVL